MPEGVYTKDRVEYGDKVYTPITHPLLFKVIDWLGDHQEMVELSSRKLAEAFTRSTDTKVSKDWALLAKNYWIVNGGQ